MGRIAKHWLEILLQLFSGTRQSLEAIKRRLQSDLFTREVIADSRRPLFKVNIVLAIPKIAMSPSLEEVQMSVTKAVQAIMKITETIPQWECLVSQQKQLQAQKVITAEIICVKICSQFQMFELLDFKIMTSEIRCSGSKEN